MLFTNLRRKLFSVRKGIVDKTVEDFQKNGVKNAKVLIPKVGYEVLMTNEIKSGVFYKDGKKQLHNLFKYHYRWKNDVDILYLIGYEKEGEIYSKLGYTKKFSHSLNNEGWKLHKDKEAKTRFLDLGIVDTRQAPWRLKKGVMVSMWFLEKKANKDIENLEQMIRKAQMDSDERWIKIGYSPVFSKNGQSEWYQYRLKNQENVLQQLKNDISQQLFDDEVELVEKIS